MAAVATVQPSHTVHADTSADMKRTGPTSKAYTLPPSPPLSDDELEHEHEHEHNIELDARLEHTADRPKAPTAAPLLYERALGDTELSYYLPSRADGVNDMYLHLGFRAPARLLAPTRLRAAWAYMRLLHPPLAAHVRMPPGAYTSARFVYAPPRSVPEALAQAGAALAFEKTSGEKLVDDYLNGPRTLGDTCLSRLVLGCVGGAVDAEVEAETETETLPTPLPTPGLAESARDEAFPPFPPSSSSGEEIREYDLLVCATHFLGDGMALHRFANELFVLLAGQTDGREKTTAEIEEMLREEWEARWGASGRERTSSDKESLLPVALEDALPRVEGRFRRAAGKVDFEASQKKLIGGHAFPRRKHAVRRTVVPTVALDEQKTKAVLKRCKEHGVSIANAVFALSAVAWGRVKEREGADEKQGRELPLMMYSALNLRPYLLASATADKSYWFTAIGYLNIILPSFLPRSAQPQGVENAGSSDSRAALVQKTFWHRARACKRQIAQTAKHPLLVSRTREMATVRGARARAWAKEDDEKEMGVWVAPTPAPAPAPDADADADASPSHPWTLPRAPSTALVGLSMLGNLDSVYAHAAYPALGLHTLTTGSRQRAGAMLLFGYTFCGRLWLSLGFDENGFAEGVVGGWWAEVMRGVDEFLVG